MPYTASHAIASWPLSLLTGRLIPISSIILGCCSPYFPYLLALTPTHAPGHSFNILSVLLYCILPALPLLFIWYAWIERPTASLFKLPVQSRPLTFIDTLWMMVSVSLGLLLGAYSHIIWDASSHATGEFVASNSFWQHIVLGVPLYKWNQYGSGVLGLFGLLIWYAMTLFKQRQMAYTGHLKLGIICYVSGIAFVVVLTSIIHKPRFMMAYLLHTSIGVMMGAALGACVYALVIRFGSIRFRLNRHTRQHPQK